MADLTSKGWIVAKGAMFAAIAALSAALIVAEMPSLRLHICYSKPTDEDIRRQACHHAERVSVDLLKRLLPSNQFDFYICGPPSMMSSLVEGLKAWGVAAMEPT